MDLTGLPDLASAKELAALFSVDRMTISRMCRRGVFPHAFKAGNSWRIPKADVEAYLQAQWNRGET